MTSQLIITSAIYTFYGKCSTEECIEQTKETTINETGNHLKNT
jgi:hypothetical protein